MVLQRIRTLAFGLILSAASTMAVAQSLTATPEASWQGVLVTSDSGGRLHYFFGTRVVDGRIAICGTGYTEKTNSLHQRLVPGIIADMRFVLGSVQLMHHADHFRFYQTAEEMRKSPAGCTLTRVAADPALLRQPLRVEQRRGYATDW
jgi:hypothetical protein